MFKKRNALHFTHSINPLHVFLFIHYKPLKPSGHFFSRNRNAFSIFEWIEQCIALSIDIIFQYFYTYAYLLFIPFLVHSREYSAKKIYSFVAQAWSKLEQLSSDAFKLFFQRVRIMTRDSHVATPIDTIFSTSCLINCCFIRLSIAKKNWRFFSLGIKIFFIFYFLARMKIDRFS